MNELMLTVSLVLAGVCGFFLSALLQSRRRTGCGLQMASFRLAHRIGKPVLLERRRTEWWTAAAGELEGEGPTPESALAALSTAYRIKKERGE